MPAARLLRSEAVTETATRTRGQALWSTIEPTLLDEGSRGHQTLMRVLIELSCSGQREEIRRAVSCSRRGGVLLSNVSYA